MELFEENEAQWRMFCRNLLSCRKRLGMTEDEMAALLDIDSQILRLIEKETLQVDIPIDVVLRAARLFRIKPSELFLRLL